MIVEKPIKGEGRKLKFRKHGPYRVTGPVKSGNTWVIQTEKGTEKTVNVLDLEIYRPRKGDPRAALRERF